jgi:transposase
MILDLNNTRIFLRPGCTDLRKGIDGLAGIVEGEMGGEPFSGAVYLFCNRGRKLLKALWWDWNGFWLSQKRLEKDVFPWPDTIEAVQELTGEQLQMLLKGIDFFRAHKAVYYKKVVTIQPL